jgi:hypothetical protein
MPEPSNGKRVCVQNVNSYAIKLYIESKYNRVNLRKQKTQRKGLLCEVRVSNDLG